MPALILARLLGPASYGTFALAFLAWFLVLSVIRSAFMQPYTVAASGVEDSEWHTLTSETGGIVVAVGLVATIVFSIAGLIVGRSSELGLALFAIALVAPGLALQEFWRVASFAARRARTAAANDFFWAIGEALAFTIVLLTTKITAAESLLAWGAGACLAAALGMKQLSVRPRLGLHSLPRARHSLHLGGWFTGSNVVFSASLFGVAAIVAAGAGSRDLGLFRMVQGNLFGPVQLGLIGIEAVFFPHLVRSIRHPHTATGLHQALRYSIVLAILVAVYGGILLPAAPAILSHVFGSTFIAAAPLVLPMAVAFTLDAASDGATVLLRARAQGRKLLTMQIAAASARVLFVLLLMRPYGLLGAAWGVAIGSAVSNVLCWRFALPARSQELKSDAKAQMYLSENDGR